jgi:hypothetical protein
LDADIFSPLASQTALSLNSRAIPSHL